MNLLKKILKKMKEDGLKRQKAMLEGDTSIGRNIGFGFGGLVGGGAGNLGARLALTEKRKAKIRARLKKEGML